LRIAAERREQSLVDGQKHRVGNQADGHLPRKVVCSNKRRRRKELSNFFEKNTTEKQLGHALEMRPSVLDLMTSSSSGAALDTRYQIANMAMVMPNLTLNGTMDTSRASEPTPG
jgi:hypothetical protein